MRVITMPLAYALFGESAFPADETDFLLPEVKQFIDVLLVQTWNRYRKGLLREANRLKKDQEALEKEWHGECHIVLHEVLF